MMEISESQFVVKLFPTTRTHGKTSAKCGGISGTSSHSGGLAFGHLHGKLYGANLRAV